MRTLPSSSPPSIVAFIGRWSPRLPGRRGVVRPAANKTWTAVDLPRPTYDPARAAALLDGLELRDRDNDGLREDAAGRPVRFAVLVQSGITAAQTAMGFMRDALANLGVGVDIVALDQASVIRSWAQGTYDAVYQHMREDTDPAGNLDFWLSSGNSHLWHPGQKTPATPLEAEIDRRMLLVASTIDQAARVREFAKGAAADADAQPR